MPFAAPMPFAAAVARLESKTPVASRLRTKDWSEVALGLRDRALFSAGVEEIKVISSMGAKLDEALSVMSSPDRAFMDRGKFISEMRQELGLRPGGGSAYAPEGAAPGDSRELTDLTSTNRLGLIYDFQVEDAREFGRFQVGQDPAILDEFPAQELIRLWEPKGGRDARRDWPGRWTEAGGQFFDSRMIALKDDPIWTKISRFGRPWPPFDFASGMGLEDIDRDEAEALGLIKPGETVAPQEADFNQGLQASVPKATPALLEGFKDIFGDDVGVNAETGKITWTGDRLGQLYQKALTETAFGPGDVHDLGSASSVAVAAAQRDLGIDLTGYTLEVRAREIRHAIGTHGTPGDIPGKSGETRGDQTPIGSKDARAIAAVWRSPDRVQWGVQPAQLQDVTPAGWSKGSLQMISDLGGNLYIGEYIADTAGKLLRFGSMWRKKQ